MTKDEALKLALEVAELGKSYARNLMVSQTKFKVAITAIQEALAQPEQEPVAWMHDAEGRVDVIHSEVKALWIKVGQPNGFYREKVPCKVEHYTIPLYAACQVTDNRNDDAIIEINKALAQPERPQNCGSGFCSCIECVMEPEQKPEPVGQLQEEAYGRGQVLWFKKLADRSLLYTSPPAREWVGLNDEEILKFGSTANISHDKTVCDVKFARAIEAKLKELNA
jgi:hypothetical protein